MGYAATAEVMPTDQVAATSAPAKVVGMRFVLQSAIYDSAKVLSIIPAKFICATISEFIKGSTELLGNNLAEVAGNIFKTSIKAEDLLITVAARTMGFYAMKTYSPYGHPLQILETLTGSKTFLRTPEQNLKEGNIGEYMAQRILYTASTNTVAAAAVVATKVIVGAMAMPATVPALCAALASTYTAILVARTVADMIQDFTGVSKLNPNRKELVESLEVAREKASASRSKGYA